MKLIKARIENFRLLKDLTLDFSTDENKSLTVIRAANETGKTTCETALLWGLFGSDILPGGEKGKNYPLYPADMSNSDEPLVKIKVEIEFETKELVSLGRRQQSLEEKRYLLTRTCNEVPARDDKNFHRQADVVKLFEVTKDGVSPVSEEYRVNEIIESSLPKQLKDIYFTDGDSAMSFIEARASTGVKRKRVQGAIEALLGLKTLQSTIRHCGTVAGKFAEAIDDTDYAAEHKTQTDRLNFQIGEFEEAEENLKDAEARRNEAVEKIRHLDSQIEEIIKLGDRNELIGKKTQAIHARNAAREASDRALTDFAKILRSPVLASSMIGKAASKGMEILNTLQGEKKLPKANIPILEELLTKRETCFCGADLKKDTDEGAERREWIQKAIDASQEADAISETLTSLYYSVRSKTFGKDAAEEWVSSMESLHSALSDARSREKTQGEIINKVESEIAQLKDGNLSELRESRTQYEADKTRANTDIGSAEGAMRTAEEYISDIKFTLAKIEANLKKSGVSTTKLDTARAVESIFKLILNRMKDDEVVTVSKEMNRIFLQMIGSNPEENELTLITKAELTKDFDIQVYGPNGHMLNPDADLNGASRRAITLAFILAITKVSKVEAPNVIDTPLGMMSGYVKQSVLMETLREGSQTVLFLTHDEIKGVEEILDDKAGVIYTLTNPAHFPNMLVNKPSVDDIRVVRCECNHRQSCEVCARKEAKVH